MISVCYIHADTKFGLKCCLPAQAQEQYSSRGQPLCTSFCSVTATCLCCIVNPTADKQNLFGKICRYIIIMLSKTLQQVFLHGCAF